MKRHTLLFTVYCLLVTLLVACGGDAAAIQIYRQLGFRVEGVDLSYYTNEDYPDGEIAIFMKRRLD